MSTMWDPVEGAAFAGHDSVKFKLSGECAFYCLVKRLSRRLLLPQPTLGGCYQVEETKKS